MRLEGKAAVVSGAAAGIGEHTALLLAKEGASVTCNDILDTGMKVAEEILSTGGAAKFVKADVSKPVDAKHIIDTTIDSFGRLDILVNNAGIVIPGRIDNTSEDDWDRTMAVNVRGAFLLSKYSIPHLKKTKGVIVNVSSAVAIGGFSDRAAYTASKGALLSLTRAMAADYVDDQVRVNCICPGTTDTPSLGERLSQLPDPKKAREQFIERQPLKRLGKPSEIAEGILYLATAEFCTGTCLSVDGGMTL
ncbi:MAG: SDR family NAD(P)-dependent oxidoreductase [Candidatus Thorarchaeota archaeon]|jgi:NAD(P)-dependent dehydrogenase (short-subunit alcohol dehydrogenase family)